jgi:hypothetical protein
VSALRTISPAAGISWVSDAGRVVVASSDGRRAHVLEDADATIWAWLSMSLPERRLAEMVGALLELEPEDAAEHLRVRLLAWRDAGLLEGAAGEVP